MKQHLSLILYLLDHPEAITKPAFVQHVEATLEYTTFERTDIQAMSFYAWLKAKMLNRTYYDVLLELGSGIETSTVSGA